MEHLEPWADCHTTAVLCCSDVKSKFKVKPYLDFPFTMCRLHCGKFIPRLLIWQLSKSCFNVSLSKVKVCQKPKFSCLLSFLCCGELSWRSCESHDCFPLSQQLSQITRSVSLNFPWLINVWRTWVEVILLATPCQPVQTSEQCSGPAPHYHWVLRTTCPIYFCFVYSRRLVYF